jgi:hypothetical protein
LNISNLTIIANNKKDTYTPERQQYPPKAYNSATNDITTTFLGKTVYSQTITLNTDEITYGSGEYIIFSSSYLNAAQYVNDKKLLFDYNLSNSEGVHFATNQYDSSGVYNQSNFIVQGYIGDWVILKLPRPIILTKFNFIARNLTVIRAPGVRLVNGNVMEVMMV